jgi:hypothetical protein
MRKISREIKHLTPLLPENGKISPHGNHTTDVHVERSGTGKKNSIND